MGATHSRARGPEEGPPRPQSPQPRSDPDVETLREALKEEGWMVGVKRDQGDRIRVSFAHVRFLVPAIAESANLVTARAPSGVLVLVDEQLLIRPALGGGWAAESLVALSDRMLSPCLIREAMRCFMEKGEVSSGSFERAKASFRTWIDSDDDVGERGVGDGGTVGTAGSTGTVGTPIEQWSGAYEHTTTGAEEPHVLWEHSRRWRGWAEGTEPKRPERRLEQRLERLRRERWAGDLAPGASPPWAPVREAKMGREEMEARLAERRAGGLKF